MIRKIEIDRDYAIETNIEDKGIGGMKIEKGIIETNHLATIEIEATMIDQGQKRGERPEVEVGAGVAKMAHQSRIRKKTNKKNFHALSHQEYFSSTMETNREVSF